MLVWREKGDKRFLYILFYLFLSLYHIYVEYFKRNPLLIFLKKNNK